MDASPEVIQNGAALYAWLCLSCHGVSAEAGVLPDLRFSSAETHEEFEAIVLGGTREQLGMPSFDGILTGDQVDAIQAYVLARAEAASQ